MTLHVAGVNHRTAPLKVRERLAVPADRLAEAVALLRGRFGAEEAVVLSTCNRVELYVAAPRLERPLPEFFVAWRDAPDVLDRAYEHAGQEAIRHLFRVVASLDSMVLGETQIAGQVKDALAAARREGAAGKTLGPLFEAALRTGKRVHAETALFECKVSTSSVAVEFAEKVFQTLAGATVLLIGSGETARLVLVHLRDKGVTRVLVANRSPERAQALASELGGTAIPFDQIASNLPRADIVVSATGAPDVVLRAEPVRAAVRARRGRPLILLDIAVPRDIDEAAGDLDGVFLYNIDDLEAVVRESCARRESDVASAETIIAEEVRRYAEESRERDLGPIVARLVAKGDAIVEAEVARLMPKLAGLGDRERDEVRRTVERVVSKMLHDPIVQLKRAARNGHAPETLDLAEQLFALEAPASGDPPAAAPEGAGAGAESSSIPSERPPAAAQRGTTA